MSTGNIQFVSCVPDDRSGLPSCEALDGIVVTDEFIADVCRLCAQKVWVGPNQQVGVQMMIALGDPYTVLCFVCTVWIQRVELEAGFKRPIFNMAGD